MCISGEKYLQTHDIPSEIEDLQYLNLTQDTIWNSARVREMDHTLTQAEVGYPIDSGMGLSITIDNLQLITF